MPKSKRNKLVDLSKTKKHGMEGKKKLFETVQSCVESYANLFIFSVNDMRNAKIKSVRDKWKHSRFFIGKNKVMARALGNTPETEFRKNLHKIAGRLRGERGLLFSNQPVEEVLKWFNSYSESDYARSGNRATETVVLNEGPLSQFPHNLEPYLRQLGLPTTLKKGVIHLINDHPVCKEGDILTPETANIVKLLGYEMSEFYIKIECVWSQDGTFISFVPENKMDNKSQAGSPSPTQFPDTVSPVSEDEEEMEIAEPENTENADSGNEDEDNEEILQLVEDSGSKDLNGNTISILEQDVAATKESKQKRKSSKKDNNAPSELSSIDLQNSELSEEIEMLEQGEEIEMLTKESNQKRKSSKEGNDASSKISSIDLQQSELDEEIEMSEEVSDEKDNVDLQKSELSKETETVNEFSEEKENINSQQTESNKKTVTIVETSVKDDDLEVNEEADVMKEATIDEEEVKELSPLVRKLRSRTVKTPRNK